jgi:hypothetical protein
MNNQLAQKAIAVSLENKKLIFIFIAVQILLNLIYFSPFLFSGNLSDPSVVASIVSKSLVISIIAFFINPFLDAGLFGLAFLKLNNKKIGMGDFFHLAVCNFWGFFKVGIFLGLISALFGFIVPRVLPFVFSDVRLQQNINLYSSNIFSTILYLFFVLAYPLVIIGFFSGQNLKPLTSSIAKFFNNFAMFKFVIVILLVQYIIRLLSKLLLPEGFIYYSKILLPILTTPLNFLILIYSFLLITDYLMRDLQFDLEK